MAAKKAAGKPFMEKATGEKYASKAAFKKAEKKESPAVKRAELKKPAPKKGK